jgi:hypothetical protein
MLLAVTHTLKLQECDGTGPSATLCCASGAASMHESTCMALKRFGGSLGCAMRAPAGRVPDSRVAALQD